MEFLALALLARGGAALRALALAVGCALAASPASAATYHFSAAGNDATGNGTLAKPWKTIGKFNQLNLNPGDSVLFRAGDVFSGKMWLDANDSGTTAAGALVAPVRIGSYGAQHPAHRARIVSPYNQEAFVAHNAGGIELADLEFISGGFSNSNRTNGVHFLSDKAKAGALTRFQHIRVNNVVAQGFGLSGLQVWAHQSVGFSDVQVSDSEFFNNGYAGVYVGATQWQHKQHANVLVDRVVAHSNPGFVGSLPITGHGVVMANVDGGTIQRSVAYDNGKVNGNANVALWTYQSNAVTIQHNLAYGNRSPGGHDGGAYDIDGGVTNSIIQYNRSYDNDGAGLLLAEYQSTNPMANNVFRYNLSVNDGRDGYGGITISGAGGSSVAKSAVFHNNTVVVDRHVVPHAKGAVWFIGPYHQNIDFFNNAFVALNGAKLIAGDTTHVKSSFVGNAYWTGGGPIVLEDALYPSVQAWALASLQERIGGVFTGITADPQLLATENYRIDAASPLVDAGRMPGSQPWPSWLTSLGAQDVAGSPLYQGSGPDVGAWEHLPADFNGDGAIDGGDLALWRIAFAVAGATGRLGDADGDGDTDGADFLRWQQLVGAGQSLAPAAVNVPEPASALFAGVIVALAAMSRRAASGRRLSRSTRFTSPAGAIRR